MVNLAGKRIALTATSGKKVRLTEKETAILRFLYRAGQQPVSRETLLQAKCAFYLKEALGASSQYLAGFVRALAGASEAAFRGRGGRRAAPVFGTVLVGVVVLVVVLGDPVVVDRQQLGPAPRPGEVPIGQPALDPEVGFDVVLPGLAPGDLVLTPSWAKSPPTTLLRWS